MPSTAHPSLALLSFALLATACGGGGGGGGGPASVGGTIAFVAEFTAAPVEEPNDALDHPQDLGRIDGRLRVELCDAVGTLEDALDAFRLTSREPVRVEVECAQLTGVAGALELVVYDPVAGLPIAVHAAGRQAFLLRGTVDLVLRSRAGRAEYALRLRADRADDPRWSERDVLQVTAGDEFELRPASSSEQVALTVCEALELPQPAGVGLRDPLRGVALHARADGQLALPASSRVVAAPGASWRWKATRAAATATQRSTPPALSLEAAPSSAALYGRARLRAVPGELLIGRAVAPDPQAQDPQAQVSLAQAELLASRGLRRIEALDDSTERVAVEGLAAFADEDAVRLTHALAAGLRLEPGIEWAEPNRIRTRHGGGVTPDDSFYGLQWHYPLIDLPDAWGLTTGDDAIIVAVLDTGESNHPDLVSRQIAGYDFIASAASAGDGDGRDADPTDEGDSDGVHPSSFHGTHVAGTIAAATNNASGVAGVTWAGKVMHCRVLGTQGGTDADIATAIRYAARLANATGQLPLQRAHVVNMSLGGPGSSSAVQSAVTAARNAGLTLFASSGNENTSQRSYPAAYTSVISVAAVDRNGVRAPYSNFGTTIDLAGPGGNAAVDLDGDGFVDGVLSTLMDDALQPPSPVFAFYQGTSMACPHAAGVAALMLAANPALTPAQLETALKATATDLGVAGRDDLYGEGLINAFRAVQDAAGVVPGPGPVLDLAPDALAFGTAQTTILVGVSNAGDGLLDVDSISVSTVDGGSWLSGIPLIVPVPVTSDTAAISVHVNRTGLLDGNYSGTVTVASNGGARAIAVTMTVDSSVVVLDVDLYVLAIDSKTQATIAQEIVNPTTGLDYLFLDLPQGEYLILAGSDDDLDDAICGPGDTYCGVYPTLNEPEIVRIKGGDLTGIDFTVSGGISPLTAGPRRIRR